MMLQAKFSRSVLVTLLPLLPLLVWFCIKFHKTTYKVWESRGIVAKPGSFPFGSSKGYTREVEFQANYQQKMYKEFPGQPYFGFYAGSIPFLMLRDPEYIKIVMAKEFSHFRDRQGIKLHDDDILSQHLFNLEGDKWRALRVKMSPVFTSGKLKAMFPLFAKCSEVLNELLISKVDKQIDAKDTAARFSTDVICSCAFGWEVNSLGDEDTAFRQMGKKFMQLNFPIYQRLRLALIKYLPYFNDTTFPKITPPDVEKFMVDAVRSTVEKREESGGKRNDFIDLMIQLRDKGVLNEEIPTEQDLKDRNLEPIELTFELMTAQCFVFFVAGFETSSSVQSLCLHELSLNQEIQDRLHKEIEETVTKHGGITYQAVQDMQYLDMVVHETMRKYPTLAMLTRRCVSPFTFPDGKTVEKGDRILIPLWSLHRDPEHFPKPELFDPERFSPENKDSVNPYVYMPFGEGPRICIGSRFGLLQTKMGIITVLRKYQITPTETSRKELEFNPRSPVLVNLKDPLYLNITKRK